MALVRAPLVLHSQNLFGSSTTFLLPLMILGNSSTAKRKPFRRTRPTRSSRDKPTSGNDPSTARYFCSSSPRLPQQDASPFVCAAGVPPANLGFRLVAEPSQSVATSVVRNVAKLLPRK
jgi:hypothetical protein